MLRRLRRLFYRASLGDHAYLFLFEPGPADEVRRARLRDDGLNPRNDEIIALAAVRIRGNRILTSERFEAIVRRRQEADLRLTDYPQYHREREHEFY